MKKTKKYYRDKINANFTSARSIFLEAVIKYGAHCSTRGWRDCPIDRVPNDWNGDIIGFSYVKKTFYIDVYWQGDLTDGEDSVLCDWNGITLKAEYYWDGERTREEHGDVRFDQEQIYQAMKNFAAKYLS